MCLVGQFYQNNGKLLNCLFNIIDAFLFSLNILMYAEIDFRITIQIAYKMFSQMNYNLRSGISSKFSIHVHEGKVNYAYMKCKKGPSIEVMLLYNSVIFSIITLVRFLYSTVGPQVKRHFDFSTFVTQSRIIGTCQYVVCRDRLWLTPLS